MYGFITYIVAACAAYSYAAVLYIIALIANILSNVNSINIRNIGMPTKHKNHSMKNTSADILIEREKRSIICLIYFYISNMKHLKMPIYSIK